MGGVSHNCSHGGFLSFRIRRSDDGEGQMIGPEAIRDKRGAVVRADRGQHGKGVQRAVAAEVPLRDAEAQFLKRLSSRSFVP